MSQPSEIDEIMSEFSLARRRLVAEVRSALQQGRQARRSRREATAHLDPMQRRRVTQLVQAAHADLRRGSHPRYAQKVDNDLHQQGLIDERARDRAASAEQNAETRVRDADRRAAEAEQRTREGEHGTGRAEDFAVSTASAALIAAATEVMLAELAVLDQNADVTEQELDGEQAPEARTADMEVVELAHPHAIGDMLTAETSEGGAAPAPVPEVGLDAEASLDV